MRKTIMIMFIWAGFMHLLVRLDERKAQREEALKPKIIVETPKPEIKDSIIIIEYKEVEPWAYSDDDLEDLVSDLIDSKLD
jgi:hypothetical protein